MVSGSATNLGGNTGRNDTGKHSPVLLELSHHSRSLILHIDDLLSRINAMSLGEQRDLFARLHAQRHEEVSGLSDCESDTESSVTTASPSSSHPAPTGNTILGHASGTIKFSLDLRATSTRSSSHLAASAPVTPTRARTIPTARSTPATPAQSAAAASGSPSRSRHRTSTRQGTGTPSVDQAASPSHSRHCDSGRERTPSAHQAPSTPRSNRNESAPQAPSPSHSRHCDSGRERTPSAHQAPSSPPSSRNERDRECREEDHDTRECQYAYRFCLISD
jgi:hypothetical protein